MSDLKSRIERIESELGIDDDEPRLMWEIDGYMRVPQGELSVASALRSDDGHGFSNNGVVAYTDNPEDPNDWWRVDEHSSSHDVDEKYGWWFPVGTTFEVILDE